MVIQQDEDSPWQYSSDGKQPVEDLPDDNSQGASTTAQPSSNKSASWQAPEFIAHPHPASWYASLLIVTIALAALVFLLTRDYFATGTIVILGIIIALSAKRKPGLASYGLTGAGLSINTKKYPYSSFKSFSVLRDGDMTSINFFPLKRFMPLVSVYLARTDEDKVIKAIGDRLPYEERRMDSVDRLSRRLRF